MWIRIHIKCIYSIDAFFQIFSLEDIFTIILTLCMNMNSYIKELRVRQNKSIPLHIYTPPQTPSLIVTKNCGSIIKSDKGKGLIPFKRHVLFMQRITESGSLSQIRNLFIYFLDSN